MAHLRFSNTPKQGVTNTTEPRSYFHFLELRFFRPPLDHGPGPFETKDMSTSSSKSHLMPPFAEFLPRTVDFSPGGEIPLYWAGFAED